MVGAVGFGFVRGGVVWGAVGINFVQGNCGGYEFCVDRLWCGAVAIIFVLIVVGCCG